MISDLKKLRELKKGIKEKPYINNDNINHRVKSNKYQIDCLNGNNSNTKELNYYEQIMKFLGVDEEIVKLWDNLGVSKKYRYKFLSTLLYFNDNMHQFILEKEKENLRKFSDYIFKITNDVITRQRLLKEIKEIIFSLNDNNHPYQKFEQNLQEIKSKLKNLQNITLSLFFNVNELREKNIFYIVNNKYEIKKIASKYIFEPNFLLKLNSEIQFIRESPIAEALNMHNNFDPFLSEINFSNEENNNSSSSMNRHNMKNLSSSAYTLVNEIIFTNINLNKNYYNYKQNLSKLFKISSKNDINASKKKGKIEKDYLDANSYENEGRNNNGFLEPPRKEMFKSNKEDNKNNNDNDYPSKKFSNIDVNSYNCNQNLNEEQNHKKKYLLRPGGNDRQESPFKISKNKEIVKLINSTSKDNESIEEKLNSPERKSIINKDFIFYNDEIWKLENDYHEYFNKLPRNQIITFHIKSNLNEYLFEGSNPMLLIKSENKSIKSLCLMCWDKTNNLYIKHMSSITDDLNELSSCIQSVLDVISETFQIYNNIFIDLYYENVNDKFVIDKNINDIFKKLKFRWVKLENVDGGIRYQKMKFVNRKRIASSTIEDIYDYDNSYNFPLNIQSMLLVYCGEKNGENIQSDSNYYKELNTFNLDICEAINKGDNNKIERLKSIFSELKCIETNDNGDLIKIIQENGLSLNETMLEELAKITNHDKILISLFNYFPTFDFVSQVTINKIVYSKIKAKIEILYDKSTNQKFYMIITNDSNPFLICEINDEFNDYLFSKDKDNDNIYNKFNSFYSNLESLENNETIESIFIPRIKKDKIIYSDGIIDSNIDNINKVYNYYRIESKGQSLISDKNIIIMPQKNDIIINKKFFIAIINPEILNEFNIPCNFCAIIEP